MPIYIYKCESCEQQHELVQAYNDKPLEVCPVCKGKVKKKIAKPAVVFIGKGFYVNDSKE